MDGALFGLATERILDFDERNFFRVCHEAIGQAEEHVNPIDRCSQSPCESNPRFVLADVRVRFTCLRQIPVRSSGSEWRCAASAMADKVFNVPRRPLRTASVFAMPSAKMTSGSCRARYLGRSARTDLKAAVVPELSPDTACAAASSFRCAQPKLQFLEAIGRHAALLKGPFGIVAVVGFGRTHSNRLPHPRGRVGSLT